MRRNTDVRVTVFLRGDRGTYTAKVWRGKKLIRTEALGTRRKREAERLAKDMEERLRAGRGDDLVPWETFQQRALNERFAVKSKSYARNWTTAANAFARIVHPTTLQDADEDAISRFIGRLHAADYPAMTIASYLRHLAVGLEWGAKVWRSCYRMPDFDRPKLPKKKARGRPIVKEEFERMLMAIPDIVPAGSVKSWRRLLIGLWLSGLRIDEAHNLRWKDGDIFVGSLSTPHPMLHIMAEGQKGRRDERWPMPPAFVRFLQKTPEAERRGFVFSPKLAGGRVGYYAAVNTVSAIGTKAAILTGKRMKKNEETGKREEVDRYATAHDLRRSFLQRWSKRVPPRKLQLLARHKSFQTTEAYYLDDGREELAAELWRRFGDQNGDQAQKPERPKKRKF